MKDLMYYSNNKAINGIQLDDYMKNPKVMALRIYYLYVYLWKKFNKSSVIDTVATQTMYLVAEKCGLSKDWIETILYTVKNSINSRGWYKTEYRQRMIFVNEIYGTSENRTFVKYLGLNRSMVYKRTEAYCLEQFLSKDWIETYINRLPLFTEDTLIVLQPLLEKYLTTLVDFIEVIRGI